MTHCPSEMFKSLSQVMANTSSSGILGGGAAGLNYFVGGLATFGQRLLGHSITSAVVDGMMGGNFIHGALSCLVSCGLGESMGAILPQMSDIGQLAVVTIAGGTVSELRGRMRQNAIFGCVLCVIREKLLFLRTVS